LAIGFWGVFFGALGVLGRLGRESLLVEGSEVDAKWPRRLAGRFSQLSCHLGGQSVVLRQVGLKAVLSAAQEPGKPEFLWLKPIFAKFFISR
jgi:hypothetical protein